MLLVVIGHFIAMVVIVSTSDTVPSSPLSALTVILVLFKYDLMVNYPSF